MYRPSRTVPPRAAGGVFDARKRIPETMLVSIGGGLGTMQSNASQAPLLGQLLPSLPQVLQFRSQLVLQQTPPTHVPTRQSELTWQLPPSSLWRLMQVPPIVHSCPDWQLAQQRRRLLPSAAGTQALVEH
jgi:hypothetical protein